VNCKWSAIHLIIGKQLLMLVDGKVLVYLLDRFLETKLVHIPLLIFFAN